MTTDRQRIVEASQSGSGFPRVIPMILLLLLEIAKLIVGHTRESGRERLRRRLGCHQQRLRWWRRVRRGD